MRTPATVFLLLCLTSCTVQQVLVDTDDLYFTKQYNASTRTYTWFENRSSYVYPSYWNPYPYEMIVVRPIVVLPQTHQTGKRLSRESISNHPAPRMQTQRRGRN